MREFETGATRDTDEGKIDLIGAMSPYVLEGWLQYMLRHRKQADGKLRSADNWKKGMPQDVCMASLGRHFLEAWKLHELGVPDKRQIHDALYAQMFNIIAYIDADFREKSE